MPARACEHPRRAAAGGKAAGVSVEVTAAPDPTGHGSASVIAVIAGPAEEALAAAWTGSVLWVARSPLRPHHRRRNWFVGVFRLAAPPGAAALGPSDVRFETFRAGGPGGQHQNKTESAVRAVHGPTGIAVVARGERSQHRNRAVAVARLAVAVRLAGERAAATDRETVQSAHAVLERGRPVRTFIRCERL